jgi:uncharacterized protein YbjT (DUF2867 family)
MNVIIFGGSGFVGRNVVQEFHKHGINVMIVCSDIKKAYSIFGDSVNIKTFDIFDQDVLKNETKNFDIAINLIGKLYEKNMGDFQKFHADFPFLLAQNFNGHIIHISACGVEISYKTTIYGKTKLEGEYAIKNNAKSYNIISPSIIFGKDDNFFNLFAKLSRFLPFLPLIGGGSTLFQPISVNDVAKSVVFLAKNHQNYKNICYVACGVDVISFKEILQYILKIKKRKRFLIKLPFSVAKFYAKIINFFGIYLLTQDQVETLKYNNIQTKKDINIDELIDNLESYQKTVPQYLNT